MIIIQKSLPYKYDYLEPFISQEIMQLHYEKHHATYIKNANDIIQKINLFKDKNLEYIIKNINLVPENLKQFFLNNLGGHINHEIFWEIMISPSIKTDFSEIFIQQINKDFGSYENFLIQFKDSAKSFFGSGWIWLIYNSDLKKLEIKSFLNQNTPIFYNLNPIIGIDLWEHAFYLQYKNRKIEYIDAWINLLNKNKIAELFKQCYNIIQNNN